MAYDEGLAERLRAYFDGRDDVREKRMFGGLCFMVAGNMCCGIVKDTLMARVGPDQYDECLQQPYATEMDFTGKPMRGMIYVAPEGIAEDDELAAWASRCEAFVVMLPPK